MNKPHARLVRKMTEFEILPPQGPKPKTIWYTEDPPDAVLEAVRWERMTAGLRKRAGGLWRRNEDACLWHIFWPEVAWLPPPLTSSHVITVMPHRGYLKTFVYEADAAGRAFGLPRRHKEGHVGSLERLGFVVEK